MSSQSSKSHQQSDPEVLVKVENVGKIFCRDLKKSLLYGLKDSVRDLLGVLKKTQIPAERPLRKSEFHAVKDVSFELRRGECLGLIGRNGAGKTTLLKMLNGLIKPDAGSIEMRGRVAALIALGAGFNLLLTGRENIYINGSVLGLSSSEIDEKIDEIIDFAGIAEFIDSPVQTYSSGMNVKLGFAIATTLKSDVLIIDEVLAVGDTNFRIKCYNRIKEILPNTAVIFVSHSMFDVCKICTKIIALSSGETKFYGGVDDGIHAYNILNKTPTSTQNQLIVHKSSGIKDVILNELDNTCSVLNTSISLKMSVLSEKDFGISRVRLVFYDESDAPVAEWDSYNHDLSYQIPTGTSNLNVEAERIRLKSGQYRIAFVATDPMNHGYFFSIEYGLNIVIKNDALSGAAYKV
jgi:lipopolysaccharide transport system ATP-binding protein